MVNSLVLCHLPRRFSHGRIALDFIRNLDEAPTLATLANFFCKNGAPARPVWEALNLASQKAEETAQRLLKKDLFMVDYWSIHYPIQLRWISEPPWALFFTGNLPRSEIPVLSIVGTRRPNQYGHGVLANIVPRLETRPLQIVSGLAHGIDALAHHHACEALIPNFAVLGSGIDVLYPTDHLDLARKILVAEGGLLSEFPPGTPPEPWHFPRRNRIISALAQVVWIVQGTGKSGSLHTADHALNQSKIVAATPGDIFTELSEVPNRLIADGAHPIVRAQDLDSLLVRTPATLTH